MESQQGIILSNVVRYCLFCGSLKLYCPMQKIRSFVYFRLCHLQHVLMDERCARVFVLTFDIFITFIFEFLCWTMQEIIGFVHSNVL